MNKKDSKKLLEAKYKALDLKMVDILGVKVAIADETRVLKAINDRITNKLANTPKNRPFFITTVNTEFVIQAQEDEYFRSILNSADLAIADGKGLKLADSRVSIVPGRKLVPKIANGGYKVFYLGGREGVAQQMSKLYGGEWDEGHENVRLRNAKYEAQDKEILKKIHAYKPEVLMVAYGAPWQEKWIFEHIEELETKVVMGVGGAFDYLTGRAKLPPEWMANLGLEWLWRLILEPWRWRRQLSLIKYVWLVLRSKV